MRSFGLTHIGALGIAASVMMTGQAYAAPTCTSTITSTNGQLILDTSLGAGVCVQAADKLYGNFTFGNTPAGGGVSFSWTAPIGGLHTEQFVAAYVAGTTYTGLGFEVTTGPGTTMTMLTGDFDQSNPAAAVSTLLKTTDASGSLTCTRTPTTCPVSMPLIGKDLTDLVVTDTLTLGSGASTGAIRNDITEVATTTTPEPASLAVLGAALVGFGMMRRRRKVA